GFFSENSAYRNRFLTRARKHGLKVSESPSRGGFGSTLGISWWAGLGYAQIATVAIALLLLTIGILGYSLRQNNARYRILAADVGAMRKKFSEQSSPAPNESQEDQLPRQSSPETVPAPPVRLPSVPGNDAELVKVRQDRVAAEARSRALEEQLQTIDSE